MKSLNTSKSSSRFDVFHLLFHLNQWYFCYIGPAIHSPTSEDTSSYDESERISNVSRQIKLKSLVKPSKFNILRCGGTTTSNDDSLSSPEEGQPKKITFIEEDKNEEEKTMEEEYEKLDIQPFPDRMSPSDQIIENQSREGSISQQLPISTPPMLPLLKERFGEETVNSPQIKIRGPAFNPSATFGRGEGTPKDLTKDSPKPQTEEQEKYIDEIIKRHRHTFSRRVLDASKSDRPEEIEQIYMSAMGKSIIAFNYKPKISKNPLKKFNTVYPQSQYSMEDAKTGVEPQFSPSNKITLVPVRRCFKMESMQEIDFNRGSNASSSNNQMESNLTVEKQEIVSQMNSLAEAEPANNKIAGKIFEDLLIIGVDKSDINAMDPKQINTQKNLLLNPKILYSFKNETEAPELT